MKSLILTLALVMIKNEEVTSIFIKEALNGHSDDNLLKTV